MAGVWVCPFCDAPYGEDAETVCCDGQRRERDRYNGMVERFRRGDFR